MKFLELWNRSVHMDVSTQQAWLKAELSLMLLAAGVRAARKGPGVPDRMVIGIAEYARSDFELLDVVCPAVLSLGVTMEFFLCTDCQSLGEINEYVPDTGPVFHSPIVGIWRAGVLEEVASGYTARELIHRELSRGVSRALRG